MPRKDNRGGVPMLGPERRFAVMSGIELRAVENDTDPIGFKGHAALFNTRTWIGPKKWGFWEEVAEGAFSKTIAEGDVRLLLNHDPNFALARSTVTTGPGSLRLAEDSIGLATDADMAPTTYARDLAISLGAGVITQMSFSFLPVKEEWSSDDEGNDVRKLREVQLFDVSPVTFPAYTETDAALRSVGLDLLMEAVELNDEQRMRLASAVRSGVVPPDLAPVIRAASQALVDLAQKLEPSGEDTRAEDDPLAIKSEHIRRRTRAIAVLGAAMHQEENGR